MGKMASAESLVQKVQREKLVGLDYRASRARKVKGASSEHLESRDNPVTKVRWAMKVPKASQDFRAKWDQEDF